MTDFYASILDCAIVHHSDKKFSYYNKSVCCAVVDCSNDYWIAAIRQSIRVVKPFDTKKVNTLKKLEHYCDDETNHVEAPVLEVFRFIEREYQCKHL